MSLKPFLIPPVQSAFTPIDTPAIARLPEARVALPQDAPPGAAAATAVWASQPEWNTAHRARMRGVEWVVGAAVMAYFAAGLAGALGLV